MADTNVSSLGINKADGTTIQVIDNDGEWVGGGITPGAGTITPEMLDPNNVSGLLGYDGSGDGAQIDSLAANAVLKDNGSGATPSFGFINANSVEDPGLAGTNSIVKWANFVYDFAVDGGTIGTITPATNTTIPNGAVVIPHLCFYRVLTTCTSATDAATIAVALPTDGTILPAVDIADAANPWDAGGHVPTSITSSLLPVTTAARQLQIVIAAENVTAGKIAFAIPYQVIG